jgi:hypothetical protein
MAEDESDAVDVQPLEFMRSMELFQGLVQCRLDFQTNDKSSVLQLLIEHRSSSATCAKDKVYALLGLLEPDDLRSSV